MTEHDLDPRRRILLEIERLKRQIYNCDHCLAIRNQIVELANILPPEALVISQERYLAILNADEERRRRLLNAGLGNRHA